MCLGSYILGIGPGNTGTNLLVSHLPTGLPSQITGLDQAFFTLIGKFLVRFLLKFFCFIPSGRLSWLPVSGWRTHVYNFKRIQRSGESQQTYCFLLHPRTLNSWYSCLLQPGSLQSSLLADSLQLISFPISSSVELINTRALFLPQRAARQINTQYKKRTQIYTR